jgi:hypothetical protein
MEQNYVVLTTSTNPFQKTVIEEILKAAEIPFRIQENPTAPKAILGAASPLAIDQFQVPAQMLQQAKDALCAQGVLCEVSERLLRRCMEEIVKPLLPGVERDLGRLKRFVEVNNKETVRALFEAVLKEGAGRDLLEELFFEMAREGASGLALLAQALQPRMNAAFREKFQSEATLGPKPVRLTLLGVISELPADATRTQTLAAAMRDRDADIREAASEALFSIGIDPGYDPEDPPAEREAAVQKLLGRPGR